ncbi:MAG: penicillin-binding protein, partial [Anaerolineae bacterium]|nr:penicillin-binding protein [Anaerolineae bacterium]
NVSNGALVAIDPRTGEIEALVGSADFFDAEISGQVNVAISPRQPGSTMKPFTYLATFERPENWWTPATVIDDVRTEFDDGPGRPPYVPNNYDGKEHGRVSVRTALANSYNIPAVKALQSVGVDALLHVAERFGMTTLTEPGHPLYGLSLTLGGGEVTLLEMTSAYGALANGGVAARPTTILCVLDATGSVLERLEVPDLPAACRDAPVNASSLIQQPQQQRAASAQHAYLLTDILKDNEARTPTFGANSSLVLDRPAAVKTGTTNDVRDIWTVGYTPQLVTGVWVGNADGSPMNPRLSGIA